jgi:flagellar basal body P-ring formation protein FlgA
MAMGGLKIWLTIWVSLILITTFARATEGSSQTGISIWLPAVATVPFKALRLGDIAKIDAQSNQDRSLLSNLDIGFASSSSTPFIFERETLAKWIAQRTGITNRKIKWLGASRVQLSTFVAETVVKGDALTSLAQNFLLQHIQRKQLVDSRPALVPILLQTDVLIPDAEFEVQPRNLEGAQVNPRMTVWLDIKDKKSKNLLRTIPIIFDVSIYAVVPVAQLDIQIGAVLSGDNIKMEEKNIVGLLPVQIAPNLIESNGYQVRRSISSGQVVSSRHVERLMAVTRGESALLETNSPGITIQSRVEVLQDGNIGQVVVVKSTSSSQSFSARVVGLGRVEMTQ